LYKCVYLFKLDESVLRFKDKSERITKKKIFIRERYALGKEI